MRRLAVGVLMTLLASLAAPVGTAAGEVATKAVISAKDGMSRVAGDDRIATAIAVSESRFEDGTASAAVLSRADAYADALTGVPLAAATDAPLLLTGRSRLDDRVLDELERVLSDDAIVYVLGGVAALSDDVIEDLDSWEVARIAGIDRYETAVAIAFELGNPSTVVLATGNNFADALTAGPLATAVAGAVLLTDSSRLPAATADYLDEHSGRRIAIGGPAATAAPGAEAVVGTSRYDTAALVAETYFTTATEFAIASGESFADGLAGGAAVADAGGPLLLMKRRGLSLRTVSYLAESRGGLRAGVAYGGIAALEDDLLVAVDALTFDADRGGLDDVDLFAKQHDIRAAASTANITVNNTVVWGQPGYHEDSQPAPVLPQVHQYRQADSIAGFWSGAVLTGYCHSFDGPQLTDGNNSISSDDQWQYTSTLVYGVVLDDGRQGFIHSAWSTKSEDTLGLPNCSDASTPPVESTPEPSATLSVSLTENPFVCDNGVRQFGTVSGAAAGERIDFASPGLGLLPGTADGNGNLNIRWQCGPSEAGMSWTVSATGSSSGRTGSFTVTGAAPSAPAAPANPPPPPPDSQPIIQTADPCPNDPNRQYISSIYTQDWVVIVDQTPAAYDYGVANPGAFADLVEECFESINGRMLSSLSSHRANLECELWVHNLAADIGILVGRADPINMDVNHWVNGTGNPWDGKVAVCNAIRWQLMLHLPWTGLLLFT